MLLLQACAETPKPVAVDAPPLLPPAPKIARREQTDVIGQTMAGLTQMLGKPVQDLREANGQRLQFSSRACILDAFLYPPVAGREPVVTYLEARLPDGRETSRAECVAALIKSSGH